MEGEKKPYTQSLVKDPTWFYCGVTPLNAVNMFYYHWLINKELLWPIAQQDRARWEIQAETQREG